MEAETRLLTKLGHEVVVATRSFDGIEAWKVELGKSGGRYLSWNPYKFVERQHWLMPFRWLAMSKLTALRRENFDLAHVAIPWNFAGMSIAYLLRQADIPFVFSIHCKFDRQQLSARVRGLVQQAMAGAIGGYAVSAPARDSFLRLYSGLLPEKLQIETIQNGIDVERFKPDASLRHATRESLQFDDQHFVVIFCGRIDPMKRPLMAVQIFARFHARCSTARMLVIGEGSEMDALKHEIESLGISKYVTLLGHVRDTAPFYIAANAYLSTSTNQEGFSLSTAEALACGIPAVVPDDDVYRAIYGTCDAVERCDPSVLGNWEDTLVRLMTTTDDERLSLRAEAVRFATSGCSDALMKNELQTFYQRTTEKIGIHQSKHR